MRITFAHTLAAVALGIFVSGCASAHGGGMAGHPAGTMDGANAMRSMGPMVGCPGPEGTADARLASLRLALHITSAQEALWSTYADIYRRRLSSMEMRPMGSMSATNSAAREGHANMPVTERVQHHETMMSAHLALLHDLRAALSPLYASMSVEQKATADAMICD